MTNPSTIPDFSAFASSLSPDQRSYIENYVAKTVTELVHPITVEAQRLVRQNRELRAHIEDLKSRVDRYESKFRDDQKYTLTRAKIVALMKELSIP